MIAVVAFLLLLALPAHAEEMSPERMAVIVNWTNLQNAVAALVAREERLAAERADLEKKLKEKEQGPSGNGP